MLRADTCCRYFYGMPLIDEIRQLPVITKLTYRQRRVAARAWGGLFPGYACGRLCCWRRARVNRPRERTSPAGIQVLASGMVRVPGPEV
jgi:hypothetical protein